MNKSIKKIITASTLILSGMYATNQYIDTQITPVTPSKNDKRFKWKDMNINYSEKGNSSHPALLLIHNLYPSSSKEEWYRIDDALAKKYHIFEIDLAGCGKSDKQNITYINYMYVQMISDFIKQIIKEKTNICATAYSSSFVFMTARIHHDQIGKIIIINPTSMNDLVKPATKKSKWIEKFICLPIIGTFLYNCTMSKSSIIDDYKYIYFYNDENVPSKAIEISYYNAHYHHSHGKYLLGSILANYTNINIIHALSKINKEIYLIGNGHYKPIIQEYKKYNEHIHAIYVSNCRLLPQLEIPNTIIEKLEQII